MIDNIDEKQDSSNNNVKNNKEYLLLKNNFNIEIDYDKFSFFVDTYNDFSRDINNHLEIKIKNFNESNEYGLISYILTMNENFNIYIPKNELENELERRNYNTLIELLEDTKRFYYFNDKDIWCVKKDEKDKWSKYDENEKKSRMIFKGIEERKDHGFIIPRSKRHALKDLQLYQKELKKYIENEKINLERKTKKTISKCVILKNLTDYMIYYIKILLQNKDQNTNHFITEHKNIEYNEKFQVETVKFLNSLDLTRYSYDENTDQLIIRVKKILFKGGKKIIL